MEVPLDKGNDVAVRRAAQQITLRVTWHFTILYPCRTLTDRDHVVKAAARRAVATFLKHLLAKIGLLGIGVDDRA